MADVEKGWKTEKMERLTGVFSFGIKMPKDELNVRYVPQPKHICTTVLLTTQQPTNCFTPHSQFVQYFQADRLFEKKIDVRTYLDFFQNVSRSKILKKALSL
jgi:hypothetical protein